MSDFKNGFWVLLFIGLTSCMHGNQSIIETMPSLEYEIVSDTLYDNSIKAQVNQSILLLSDTLDSLSVCDVLLFQFSNLSERTGFKYHEKPTHVIIHAYTTIEKAQGGSGQWLAMLGKTPHENEPSISINAVQMKSLGLVEETKFGLSEAKRKLIWRTLVLLEDSTQKVADYQFPTYEFSKSPNKYQDSNIYWNIDLCRHIRSKARKQLLVNNKISDSILLEISSEAFSEGWAFPKYRPN